jgi:hypothetical protein
VGSLVGYLVPNIEIGVATSSGRAYYRISSLLKRIGIPYSDVILGEKSTSEVHGRAVQFDGTSDNNFKIIITTRKERLQLPVGNAVCVEDLGDDVGLAKEKLFSILYPPRPNDWFIIGIDPGERTGIAAFFNHREIESSVSTTLEEAMARVSALIDNAPGVRKIVKVGSGNMRLARSIAKDLESKYKGSVRISLVNESGTSVLKRKSTSVHGTRDQRAAKLIAFRDGQDYNQ